MNTGHLAESFDKNVGIRGAHLYSATECQFYPWLEVIHMIRQLDKGGDYPEFEDKLITALANYNPDTEYIALCESPDNKVTIEMYTRLP